MVAEQMMMAVMEERLVKRFVNEKMTMEKLVAEDTVNKKLDFDSFVVK